MKERKYSPSTWKCHPLNPKTMSAAAAEWIFLVDLLNFSFWTDDFAPTFGVEYDGILRTGYWGLCAAINRALDQNIPVTDAKWMASVSEEEFHYVFRSSVPGAEIPMLSERRQLVKEAGQVLLCKFGGSFLGVLNASAGDAIGLLNLIICNFPSFMDVSTYKGNPVILMKRAQILLADLWACFEGRSFGNFEINWITAFADYRLPQQLEALGLLQLTDEFKRMLQSRTLFSVHDEKIVELRACTIHSIELIKEIILAASADRNEGGPQEINSILIDFYLWDTVKERREKLDCNFPFHRTRSTFY